MNHQSVDDFGKEIQQKIRRLITRQGLGVLATKDKDGHPYASLIAFAHDDNVTELFARTLAIVLETDGMIIQVRQKIHTMLIFPAYLFLAEHRMKHKMDFPRPNTLARTRWQD